MPGVDADVPNLKDAMPRMRKGQVVPFLSRAEFRERFYRSYFDPAFDAKRDALQRIETIAWKVYKDGDKAPRTREARRRFANPEYELSIEWSATRARLRAAAAKQKMPSTRSRVLVICGAARNDGSCPGEMSKTFRLVRIAKNVLDRDRNRNRCARFEPSHVRIRQAHLSLQGLRIDGAAVVPLAVQLLPQSCARAVCNAARTLAEAVARLRAGRLRAPGAALKPPRPK